jgi:shikimate dehydrogenase
LLKELDELYAYSNANKGSKVFCVIGYPIEHSLSPVMHNAVFKALKIDAIYFSVKVDVSMLKHAVDILRDAVNGFNVTIPHKVTIIEYMDELDASAAKVGAVNTVSNSNGRLKGYNTDYHGFIQPIKSRGVNLRGKSVLLLGAGGAARAVVTALCDEGIARMIIANRSINSNVKSLINTAMDKGIECKAIILNESNRYSYDCDLIVNATPLSMKDASSRDKGSNSIPLTSKDISSRSIVYDLVYNPIDTQLISIAKDAGAQVIYGYEMLVEQGAKALEIWLNIDAPRNIMIDAVVSRLAKH